MFNHGHVDLVSIPSDELPFLRQRYASTRADAVASAGGKLTPTSGTEHPVLSYPPINADVQ
jgi:hypothetical protein